MPTYVQHDTECERCAGPLYLFHDINPTASNLYTVACNVCGRIHYKGDVMVDAVNIIDSRKSINLINKQAAVPQYISHPNSIKQYVNNNKDEVAVGDFVSPKTQCFYPSRVTTYFFYPDDKYEITYFSDTEVKLLKSGCERVIDRAWFNINFSLPTKEKISTTSYKMSEAYEMNKSRETCVVCGNKTVMKDVCYSVVSYCDCVNKLPR